jgi:hypothetical protein
MEFVEALCATSFPTLQTAPWQEKSRRLVVQKTLLQRFRQLLLQRNLREQDG